jgi:hypothetical protein
MPFLKKSGRPAGSRNTPETCAAISANMIRVAAARRGFTDQDVLNYYNVHTIRECSDRFGVTFQRIQQILAKYNAARGRGHKFIRP